MDYIEVSGRLELKKGDPSFWVLWGPLFAVNDRNYHDGKSFVIYLLTARSYIHDHFDLLWSF